MRRSGIEFFLTDQTNYFINFPNNRRRNKVYSRMAQMRSQMPNLIYANGSRSPAEVLKTSGLTQKWTNRQVWPLTQMVYVCFLVKKSLIGKLMTHHRRYCSLPFLAATPSSWSRLLKGILSRYSALEGPSSSAFILFPELQRYKDTLQVVAVGAEVQDTRPGGVASNQICIRVPVR